MCSHSDDDDGDAERGGHPTAGAAVADAPGPAAEDARGSAGAPVSAESQQERLLSFLYRCPVGIVEFLTNGDIVLLNAYASQILMPLASRPMLDNLFEVMAPWTDAVQTLLQGFDRERGIVCSNHRVHIDGATDAHGRAVFLSFTIHKVEADRFMLSFFDDSERIAQESAIAEAIEVQAHQAGRLQLASTIMHDIGNAVTGLGPLVGELSSEPAWPERSGLARLAALLESRRAALDEALGGDKGQAMIDYVKALDNTLGQREARWRSVADKLGASIYHIQDILTIQHQSTRAESAAPRAAIALGPLIHDALTITAGTLEKRGITITCAMPKKLPLIAGDRTRLVQVLVNLLRNCADAFDRNDSTARGKRIAIAVTTRRSTAPTPSADDTSATASAPDAVVVTVTDNGPGFDPAVASELLERGATTKRDGAGLGLYSSQQTIAAHGGQLRVDSAGLGHGAVVTIELPSCPTDET
ncbi:MAG: hypothetical protein Tsb0020_49160 [Haliangiales bacterium]